MGKLYCLKCTQSAEASTFEQADILIDHAASSKKCSGNPDYLRWNGEKLGKESIKPKIVTPKPTATKTKSK